MKPTKRDIDRLVIDSLFRPGGTLSPEQAKRSLEILGAIKRVIVKRKARGATPEHIRQYKAEMLATHKSAHMQEHIQEIFKPHGA